MFFYYQARNILYCFYVYFKQAIITSENSKSTVNNRQHSATTRHSLENNSHNSKRPFLCTFTSCLNDSGILKIFSNFYQEKGIIEKNQLRDNFDKIQAAQIQMLICRCAQYNQLFCKS